MNQLRSSVDSRLSLRPRLNFLRGFSQALPRDAMDANLFEAPLLLVLLLAHAFLLT
jgi:hypothetical protein